MRFLVDAHLPRAICPVLAHPDHEALHVKDVLPLDAAGAGAGVLGVPERTGGRDAVWGVQGVKDVFRGRFAKIQA
jgi:hypothetical protein